VTADQALLRLGASTAGAIREVLETYASGGVVPGAVTIVPQGGDPLAGAALPAVLADVGYVDGVNGGNLLIVGVEGARRLAAAMAGQDPEAVEAGGELGEAELAAVGEAVNQMMGAAARATSAVLGEEVEIAQPHVRLSDSLDDAREVVDGSSQACTVAFSLCGAPCLLVLLVPHAFIVRMTRAYDELTEEYESAPLSESLRTVGVRLWAELGRTRMASGRVVALPSGAVVDLDRDVDEPIDLYADGMRFATARLLVTEDGGLAVRIEELLTAAAHPAEGPSEDAA
jgi:flagellar motor switch protein FliN/FliY